jgi:uncharacterized protein with HEPN domain
VPDLRYFGVDQQLVWTAIKERLPTIRPEIEKISRIAENIPRL